MNKEKIKILIVCKSLPDTFSGGIQTHVHFLSKSLAGIGHSVSILTAGPAFSKIQYSEEEGCTIIRIPFFPGRKLPFFRLTVEEYSFNRQVKKWLNKHAEKYDIIHLQGRSGGLLSADIAKKVPIVTTYHGFIGAELHHPASLDQRLHSSLAAKLESSPLTWSKAVVSISEAAADMLDTYYPGSKPPIYIVSNGIVPLPEEPTVEVNRDSFLFVGRLAPVKGIEVLLKAMTLLEEKIRLIVVGDGELRNSLQRTVSDLGISDRVEFVGNLPLHEVYGYMRRCAALVLPSFSETQGVVLMEANNCGRPVICTELPGTASIVRHGFNGLRVEVGSSPALAEALRKLYLHPALSDEMGKNGKAFVQAQFDWKVIAQKTVDIYRLSMGGNGS